ncbi:HAD family hydrolase [Botrimarina mediterranea]|uniref:Phosphoglycolate phosphatase n=1 Tax=Botrimarina mediterranea TaxID=2528022 RepID=A0A518K716_9BACT|nr:HAD family hydrolase [Botrimarina mediterranea]QDV73592.1 Phosphoglycolate phosphatase [Botrimarina mediterranea]QDV78183.1 Phosphoglycolate phosphatase [Planctomycetes bacterium K2D]
MRLAIVHHHLNRGGVTSVIVNHLRSLATLPAERRPERVVVLYDGQRDGWPDALPDEFPIELVVEPALAYDPLDAKADPAKLAMTLAQRLADCGLAADNTLLHTHNHSLGKNASLPGALQRLAGDGWRMLLQVHDFAEDNRPDNYRHLQDAIGETDPDRLGEVVYPQGSGLHYATLTERDADILLSAGVAAERVHPLPNPAAEFGEMPSQDEARGRVFGALGLPSTARLVVYPVRGIRRKNLGEMLLLSALAPEGTYFAVTLRPKNPVEAASFDRWRLLAESLDLPCRFDIGSPREEGGYGCDFKDALAAADAILTTSVAEGFGMVFLEAWLAGKPLIGRDLPEITSEFKAAGMRFRSLWAELRAAACLDADFAQLTPAEQANVIRQTTRPAVPLDLGIETAAADVAANAAVVRDVYSVTRLGERLAEVYGRVQADDSEVNAAISGAAILDYFQKPVRQHAIRIEGATAAEEQSLVTIVHHSRRPLDPQPTGEESVLPKLPGIRAVVFDVYGTLLISASGDISLASEGARGAAALAALEAVFGDPMRAAGELQASAPGVAQGAGFTPRSDAYGSRSASAGSRFFGDEIVKHLHAAIHTAHSESSSAHPEVEIVEIWKRVLAKLSIAGTEAQVRRLAVEFEVRANPVGPMPGVAEMLGELNEAGLTLGIISNAQFYTPLAIAALSGKPLEVWGFETRHCHWSYRWGEAKPGKFLYEKCVEAFANEGVTPQEILYIGNDVRNDIWPAQEVGMRTALFAGDARSLRWRRDDQRLAEVRPDAVVTELHQLLEIAL